MVDPYLWSMEEALKDFTSAGVDVPSTGQSRGDLYSLFLDPKFVKGITLAGRGGLRQRQDREDRARYGLADVLHARSVLPSHYELKEPITDAYTLARFAKINTGTYADTRELAREINKKIIIPEIEDLQKTGAVSWIQLDSPTIAAESFDPRLHPGPVRGGRVRREGPHRRPRLRRRGRGSSPPCSPSSRSTRSRWTFTTIRSSSTRRARRATTRR